MANQPRTGDQQTPQSSNPRSIDSGTNNTNRDQNQRGGPADIKEQFEEGGQSRINPMSQDRDNQPNNNPLEVPHRNNPHKEYPPEDR